MAIEELRHRTRSKDEKAEVFAHKIQELVKNAYPKFDDPSKESLAKDHYVSGLEADMQKELRKLTDFEDKTLADLVKQTTYFEIAGANATSLQPKCEVIAATNSNRIESRLDRLVNLMERSLGVDEEDEIEEVMEHRSSNSYNHKQSVDKDTDLPRRGTVLEKRAMFLSTSSDQSNQVKNCLLWILINPLSCIFFTEETKCSKKWQLLPSS